MRYFATIDTNVLVSALLNAESIPGKVVQEALAGNIIPLYNDEILREYNEVLRRIKFRFKREIIELTVDAIIKRGFAVDAGPIEDVLPDPKDVVFYAVTLEQKKQDDAYLVTGNIKHFPKVNFVVTPREMLDIIENERNE
ncbi:MAG: putative toxin-antitoxin system toxin component, PIN family [Clostridiaceae bacterium]|nr:putative toxin-antitoxin system toxin component, PIN family [Clostridiaceae bacterium]